MKVELNHIIGRFAEGLEAIDTWPLPTRSNQRTGATYLPGTKTLTESQVVDLVDEWWVTLHPGEFAGGPAIRTGVRYPTLPKTACDYVFSSDGSSNPAEWGVEVKHLQFVGDNGGRQDYQVPKVVSPYLKDRGLIHDALRLHHNPVGKRNAVIGYSFEYDDDSLDQAYLYHPGHGDRIEKIRATCVVNGGSLKLDPLLGMADAYMRTRGLVTGALVTMPFEAWAHPCGGRGTVFGWEVTHTTATQNPWHPW